MPEATLPSPARTTSEAFLIHKGNPAKTKEEFFSLMEQRVQRLGGESYRKQAGADSSFGHIYGVVSLRPEGKVVQDPAIYVNEEDFHIDNEDFTDLIPVVVRHEAFELWTYVKNGWSLVPPSKHIDEKGVRGVAHGLAMREMFRYALDIGKAERQLEFARKWAQRLPESERKKFLAENEGAYKRAMQAKG